MRFICDHCHSKQENEGIPLAHVGASGQPEEIGTAHKCSECGKWGTVKKDTGTKEHEDWLKGNSHSGYDF